ncbi:hypothetical protein IFM89_014180 [Coptis chinensis]|uniref:Mitochondrial import inner membrane translocase subunit TIM50 n=1 Tax=Coptis chinensis TaxID=261450 RepID=A0A835GZ99_9MAGN|nr:hypothetical protein IFM89_014180 [Coptis chinensis]
MVLRTEDGKLKTPLNKHHSKEDGQALVIKGSSPFAKTRGDDGSSGDEDFVQPSKRKAIAQPDKVSAKGGKHKTPPNKHRSKVDGQALVIKGSRHSAKTRGDDENSGDEEYFLPLKKNLSNTGEVENVERSEVDQQNPAMNVNQEATPTHFSLIVKVIQQSPNDATPTIGLNQHFEIPIYGLVDSQLEKMLIDISTIFPKHTPDNVEAIQQLPNDASDIVKEFEDIDVQDLNFGGVLDADKGHFVTPPDLRNIVTRDLLDCGIIERQFLNKKKELKSKNKEGMLIERPLISKTNPKLLILDVNGLLLHIGNKLDLPSDCIVDKFISGKAILKGSFCVDFPKFCFQRFNVGVWSSRTKQNLDGVLDIVMGDMKSQLLLCWDQSHCSTTGFYTVDNNVKLLMLKELVKLWDKDDLNLPWEKRKYNESNSLLVDDSLYKALLNPAHTAIFPTSYDFRNKNDNSLRHGGDIRMYLEGLVTSENVQKYIKQHLFGQPAVIESHPCWRHY